MDTIVHIPPTKVTLSFKIAILNDLHTSTMYERTLQTHRKPSSRKHCKTRKRQRSFYTRVHHELGRNMFRRAYRMHLETFEHLFGIIEPYLRQVLSYNGKRNYAPNGTIPLQTRLACVIRIFAGASAYDLISVYGISKTEILDSVWYVVDAITSCKILAVKFPETHEEQKKIPKGFRNFHPRILDTVWEILMD